MIICKWTTRYEKHQNYPIKRLEKSSKMRYNMYSDNVRLGNITTMRVGGSANVVRPDSVTALIETVNRLKDRGKNFFVLGA